MAVLSPPGEAPPPDARRRLLLGSTCGAALHSLGRNKTRTFLSTLGIVVGVGCVILMMAVAEGTRVQMLAAVRRLGSTQLSIRPGEQRTGGIGLGAGTQQSLSLADAAAVARQCPAVVRSSPRVRGSAQIVAHGENTQVGVLGITNDYLTIRQFRLASGRLFTHRESASRARVCLLGPAVAQMLFGKRDPLGQRVHVQGQPFRVIGVLQPHSPDWDTRIWVPVTTAMYRMFPRRPPDRVGRIEAQAVDEAHLNAAQRQIEILLRHRHHLGRSQPSDFEIHNRQERLEAARATSRILTYLLVSIASISLLVGGIGVMNVMLVSVTERTREIGIRRAVGARERDILSQFLIEAVVMCGIGAGLGVLTGGGACWLAAVQAAWPVVITPVAVALASGFAVAVGLVFGLYPAVRAAHLSPLTALRHE